MTSQKTENAYAQHQSLYGSVGTPAHIPADRVVDFDYHHPTGMEQGDVYSAWKQLHNGPDVIWTPRNGGHWIVTRGEDVKFIQEHYEVFSHEVFSIPRGSSPVQMPPLTVDPPFHARYRAVLNPSFTPVRVREMRDSAEKLTIDLIERIKPHGGCDFLNEFARVMPVVMFLGIVDLPLDRRQEFSDWAKTFITSTNSEEKLAAHQSVVDYLSGVIDERYKNPGVDLLSRIASWRDNKRYQSEEEVIGMALLIFFGGLDTVANMLSFIARHLAQNPSHRKRLIDEPEIIPQAVEEYLRRFGLSNTGRLVLKDYTYKGIIFKKDEMVMVPISLSSMDERLYDSPMDINFDRKAEHNTFGNGPHKCVGSPLARAEITVFLEQWLKAIPDFRLNPASPPITHSGPVNGMSQLHLVWDV